VKSDFFNGMIYPKGLSKNSTCMTEYINQEVSLYPHMTEYINQEASLYPHMTEYTNHEANLYTHMTEYINH